MTSSPQTESSIFDISLLPPADVQFLVVSDTHYLLPDNAQAAEWPALSQFPVRTARALKMAGALPHDFAVHLGDVSHEYPETGRTQPAWHAALAQFRDNGLTFRQAAGNMDIGDKPDPTSPAEWVSPETLQQWHATFGPSWYSFDHGDIHGVVLNTQIMNGPLPEAGEQQRWAEADLATHANRRLLLFLHMPIYFVEPNEQALGFYNSLDEPARGWLLELIQRFGIELVFAGHTHFVALNRVGLTRLYVAPSTATSRAGLAEAFTSPAPDRGRGDVDKLGFYFVRLNDSGASVHLIRTGRETPAADPADSRRLLVTRVSRDLAHGRLGVMASHPLGHVTPGPVIWPSIVRQPVRDDWRLLACTEMGARFVRVPASDLDEPSEQERLAVLRDEGVAISAYWLWHSRFDIGDSILAHRGQIDTAEIILPGETLPSTSVLGQVERIQKTGLPVTLAPALRGLASEGQYHQRTRVGYQSAELAGLNSVLQQHGARIDRVACRIMPGDSVWSTVEAFRDVSTERIDAFDFYLDLPVEDDAANANLTAEAIMAIAAIARARLVLGPLVDLDRSMDAAHGLLDRLSNPRPAFHVARCLNTLLFRSDDPIEPAGIRTFGDVRLIELRQGNTRLMLLLAGADARNPSIQTATKAFLAGRTVSIYELASGLTARVDVDAEIDSVLERASGPLLFVDK